MFIKQVENGFTIDISSRSYIRSKKNEFFDVIEKLYHMSLDLDNNDYYAEIIPGNKPLYRDGSIGKITNILIPDRVLSYILNYYDTKSLTPKPQIRYSYVSKYNYRTDDISYSNVNQILSSIKISIKCDKKHKDATVDLGKVKFYTNFTGECKYVNEKPAKTKKEEIILKDKFDNDITVGSFIVFANSTSRQQGRPKFGHITKITSNNVFYAKNLKLSSTDYSREYILREPHEVILMDDDLMSQLTLARLSY